MGPLKASLLVIALIVGVRAQDARADAADGRAAFDRGDHATARAIWAPLADTGDRDAQYGLGQLYHEGLGVERDEIMACTWWLRAASRDLPEAQYAVGRCYETGIGFERGSRQAEFWYRGAALSGHGPAESALERMTAQGEEPAMTADAGAPADGEGAGYRAWLSSVPVREAVDPEWARLVRRYAPLLDGASPIVLEAQTAQGTVYRLAAGPLELTAADGLCAEIRMRDPDRSCFVQKHP